MAERTLTAAEVAELAAHGLAEPWTPLDILAALRRLAPAPARGVEELLRLEIFCSREGVYTLGESYLSMPAAKAAAAIACAAGLDADQGGRVVVTRDPAVKLALGPALVGEVDGSEVWEQMQPEDRWPR